MAPWLTVASAIAAVTGVLLYARQALPWAEALPLTVLSGAQIINQTPLREHIATSWDLHYHLGGNGPWIPKKDGVLDESIEAPAGCHVDQVHMLSRHAERYPTVKAGLRMLELYDKLQAFPLPLNGSLAFAKQLDMFTDDPSAHLENLVSTSRYAGTLQAFHTGVKLRTRYKWLLDRALERGKISFWASDSQRVVDTAHYFAGGFFRHDWQHDADLHVIPETSALGGDTLTSGKTCLDYADNVNSKGHDYGYAMLSDFQSSYLPLIRDRLARENPLFPLAEAEVWTMQELCGFETIATEQSQWCSVFTHAEMESFAYARDLLHYYRAGPGNPYAGAMGHLWLNATAQLLRDGGEVAGHLFLSFVHDGDIVPMLAALDLLPQQPHLPTTHVDHNRTWRTSDVVPMGGRVIFERLSCEVEPECWDNGPFYPNHKYCEPDRNETYVRINVDDGVVGLPGCSGGPDGSCLLEDFLTHVKRRGQIVGDFADVCGLPEGAAKHVTFLHQ